MSKNIQDNLRVPCGTYVRTKEIYDEECHPSEVDIWRKIRSSIVLVQKAQKT